MAIKAAEILENDGISIEIFDPRSLLPFDKVTLFKSVKKTGKLVIFDDSNKKCGFAGDVSALVVEECFDFLKAPIKRVSRADVPVPFSSPLENAMLPNEEKLLKAIREII